MATEQPRWYKSKIDWWLIPVLCIPPVVSIVVVVSFAIAGEMTGLLIGAAVAVFVAALYLGLVFPMRYGLNDTHLIIRHGICRQKILLTDIADVYPTRNPLSSPALSLDRLHIQFGEGFFKGVMISPAERETFLEELANKAGLKRQGDHLVR